MTLLKTHLFGNVYHAIVAGPCLHINIVDTVCVQIVDESRQRLICAVLSSRWHIRHCNSDSAISLFGGKWIVFVDVIDSVPTDIPPVTGLCLQSISYLVIRHIFILFNRCVHICHVALKCLLPVLVGQSVIFQRCIPKLPFGLYRCPINPFFNIGFNRSPQYHVIKIDSRCAVLSIPENGLRFSVCMIIIHEMTWFNSDGIRRREDVFLARRRLSLYNG